MRESDTYGAVSNRGALTTVRSYTNSVGKTTACEDASTPLVWSWPLELTGDERASVSFLLTGLSHSVQQSVVDEVAGRLEAGKVKNTMAFLHTLAKRAASNTFQATHFGRGIADKRKGTVMRAGTSSASAKVMPIIPAAGTLENTGPEPLSAETEEARKSLLERLGLRR